MEIGTTYTTTTSGITGIIKAVDNHPSGVNRILLDVNGTERWTSAPANYVSKGQGLPMSVVPAILLKQTNLTKGNK